MLERIPGQLHSSKPVNPSKVISSFRKVVVEVVVMGVGRVCIGLYSAFSESRFANKRRMTALLVTLKVA